MIFPFPIPWSRDFLEKLIVVKLTHRPDDGGSRHLLNVGRLPPDYTAQQPRRQPIFTLAAVRT
jgi:hypothetical protein